MEHADKTLIADALEYYADMLGHSVEWLAIEKARSAPTLANRARRARALAISINAATGRDSGGSGTPDPFTLSPSQRTALAANERGA